MIVGVTNDRLCLLEFNRQERVDRTISKLKKTYHYSLIKGEDELFDKVEEQLKEYFAGTLKEFNLPLELIGTPFEKNVWNKLLTIPYGETRSYLEIAKSVEKPTAFRAVARANGSNNISIIIPCHRVIASNGKLQGYGGGLWRKELLLKLEKTGTAINKKQIKEEPNIKQVKLLENWLA